MDIRSLKTTVAGVLVGLFLFVGELADLAGIPLQDFTNGTFEPQLLAAGAAALGLGWFARDDNQSSEGKKVS